MIENDENRDATRLNEARTIVAVREDIADFTWWARCDNGLELALSPEDYLPKWVRLSAGGERPLNAVESARIALGFDK